MPRRSILSTTERDSLFALPESKDELIRLYTFNELDLSVIRQHRGAANRLGFAVQLCYMRYPSVIFGANDVPHEPLLQIVAEQLKINPAMWVNYGQRENTRWEHLAELQTVFGFKPFTMQHYRSSVRQIELLARDTDKGILLATELVDSLRRQNILLPGVVSPNRRNLSSSPKMMCRKTCVARFPYEDQFRHGFSYSFSTSNRPKFVDFALCRKTSVLRQKLSQC